MHLYTAVPTVCQGLNCVFKLLKYSVGFAGSLLNAFKRRPFPSLQESNELGENPPTRKTAMY